jgi:hypothetical protein
MGQQRTAWHVGFFRLIEQRRPSCFEVTSEYPFGTLPQRADLLLVRRLWPEVRREGIVEYKSPASPYAHSDLLVLLGCQHFSASADRLPEHFDLLLALAVSHMTPARDHGRHPFPWMTPPSPAWRVHSCGRRAVSVVDCRARQGVQEGARRVGRDVWDTTRKR